MVYGWGETKLRRFTDTENMKVIEKENGIYNRLTSRDVWTSILTASWQSEIK